MGVVMVLLVRVVVVLLVRVVIVLRMGKDGV